MYGKGAYSLAKDIGVSVKEADAFLKNYLAAFPKVSGYMDKTIADAKAVGYVSTLFGRRRALPELASSNFNVRSSGERMARNTPIQGTAADVIKLAMVRVWKRLRDEKMESRLILTVHDELIVEAPQAEAEKAAQILREEMEGCVQYAVPLSTDVHAGKTGWRPTKHDYLGIESTCDETAAALVEDGRHLLSNIISTSVKNRLFTAALCRRSPAAATANLSVLRSKSPAGCRQDHRRCGCRGRHLCAGPDRCSAGGREFCQGSGLLGQ